MATGKYILSASGEMLITYFLPRVPLLICSEFEKQMQTEVLINTLSSWSCIRKIHGKEEE